MLIYILKFSACLAIFMVFYKLFLERENMHLVKRWFLLVSLVLSLTIPLVTFTTYVEPVIVESVALPMESFVTYSEVEYIPEETNYLPIVLWSIYALGVLLFGIKFILNLLTIVRKIKSNPKLKNQSFIHVLLKDLIIPHTFFNYIFLNKHKFETNDIPNEVFWHEQAHANQKHSVDVLCIELLQVAFWFHPLIYLMKHNIQLNHEFLADQAVLNKGIQPSTYQQILLEFSSNSTETSPTDIGMANAINYSSIKKRFTVMKTHTSKQKIWIRSLLLLPLIGLALYGFSQKKEVVKETSIQLSEQSQTLQGKGATTEMMKEYNNWIKQINGSSKIFIPVGQFERLVAIYDLMSEVQRNSVEPYPSFLNTNLYKVKPNIPTTAQFESWKNNKEFALWIDGKHVPNSELNKYEVSDIAHFTSSMIHKNAHSEKFPQPFQNSLYTKQGFKETYQMSAINDYNEVTNTYTKAIANYLKGSQTDNSELKILKAQADRFYNQFNKDELKEYGILPAPPVPAEESGNSKMLKESLKESVDKTNNSTKYNQSATPEEVAEYNKIAKHCNSQIETKSFIVKQKDVKRLEQLYAKMSVAQKNEAETYPDFSKFPPPLSPSTGFVTVNGETLFVIYYSPKRYYNKKGYLVDKNGKTLNGNIQVNASDVLPGQYITKVYQNDKVVVEFKDNMQKQQTAIQEEVAEYNKLATQHNHIPERQRIYKQKDVVRMEYLYKRMSKDQQANAEPFPNFPPPPPPPPAPEAQKLEMEKDVPPPPPPPAPISPLDHVIQMAKKGAKFYYEGKPISSDEAIKLLKKNNELNISTKQVDSKEPKVYISKDPITVKE